MVLPVKSLLRQYFCNFNAIALALLAFQNAGYIVLMGYAHRLQDAPTALDEPPRKRFSSTHFIATTEAVKLIICALWCCVDVLLDMQKSEQDAAEQTCIFVEHEEPLLNVTSTVKPTSSNVSSPGTRSASLVFPRSPASPTARRPEYSLRRIIARPNFNAQFATRLRHAVGFDEKYKEAMLMVVPAVLYTIQGLLLILALQYLDPTVFQILYQVRIMFLALMMRVVLDFRLSLVRWVALVGLMVGIILAQLAMQQAETAEPDATEVSAKAQPAWSLKGTLAALTGAFMSSFSGVFTEYVYKHRGNLFTLSARSIHLAFFSLVYFFFVFGREALLRDDALSVSGKIGEFLSTFFDGFTGLVWLLVVLQAMGGILVGLVVRYCDNIVKSFSTAFAIVLSGAASVFLFDLAMSPMFLLGSLLVMISITVYSVKK